MKVIFFTVDNVLNFPESDAIAPSGRKGVADSCVKKLKSLAIESGSKIVLIGPWKKDWDFDDTKCTPDGTYLNKKLNKRGLHILDKIRDDMTDEDGYADWIRRHPNVTESCVLTDIDDVKWTEW